MSALNIAGIVISALFGAAVLYFVISRNRRDRKEFDATEVEDVMEETKTDHQRNSEKL